MDGGDRLYDLLLAIFRTDEELRRFLVLEQILPPDNARKSSRQAPSKADTAFNTVELLLRRDLVDQRLFDALLRRNPERENDIRSVADVYLAKSDDDDAKSDVSSEDVPAEYAKFTAELDAELAAVSDATLDPVGVALDDSHWPWSAAVSVLGSFRPNVISPLRDHASDMSATDALADLIFTSHSGRWVMEDTIRIACLRRLDEWKILDEAIRANAKVPDTRRDLLRTLVTAYAPVHFASMSSAELNDLDAVTGWLEAAGISSPISRADIEAAVERRWLIDPLRTLVGAYFTGRHRELAEIRSCVDGTAPTEVLSIRGPGGAGKSTLLGKILLDLEDLRTFDQVAFAYVDFDKSRHDPRDASGLLGQIARQLRLLYATSSGNAAEFAAVEAYSSNTDMDAAAELLEIPTDLDAPALTEVLAQRLIELNDRTGGRRPPLVLVLDTCEEVLAKGPGAVHDLVQMVTRLRDTLPGMRLITAGRSVIEEFDAKTNNGRIELGDLDRESADALLTVLGVSAKQIRTAVIDRFGSNPLTLRLAAKALSANDDASTDVDDLAPDQSLDEVGLEQVQGMLYARILGHIADREVAAVAHPGLVVRRITVPVLQEILSGPCGFDPAIAPDLFRRLGRELSMFELEGDDTLRHRSDVRRLMLRTMLDDGRRAKVVREIHDRAVDFYSRRTSNEAKAEEIYHRLMRGDDPATLNQRWRPELARLLEDVLEEPLPEAARPWLTRRVRHDDPALAADSGDWNQYDWEANAARRAMSWLNSRSPEEALAVLRERPKRLPASRLYALDVDAHLMMDDADAAARALDEGLRNASGTKDLSVQLELAERTIRVKALQHDWAGVDKAARQCLAITDATGETRRGIDNLTLAMDLLRDVPDKRAALGKELSRRFVQFTRDDLRANPEMARRAVVAATDNTVLVHAAQEVGDRAGESDGVYLDDAFALTRLLDGTSSAAEPALAALATEVGITGSLWQTDELARRALRTGRSGAAISLGLQYAADEDSAHQLVVQDLTPSVETMM
jgi:hypothetical protein